VVCEVREAASITPDSEMTGKAWLNVVVRESAAGIMIELEFPKTYTFLLPILSISQPTRTTVMVPASPLTK